MAVVVTGGYGIPSRTPRGGWTVSYGYGGFVSVGLRIFRTSFRPDTMFATIGDSPVASSQESIAAVATSQPDLANASPVGVTPITSTELTAQVSSREPVSQYSSPEGPGAVSSQESTTTAETTENATTAETTDPSVLLDEE